MMAESRADDLPAQADASVAAFVGPLNASERGGGSDSNAMDSPFGTGFRQRPIPSREEMIGQGMAASEADRVQVDQHQRQVLAQSFERWVIIFAVLLCLMLPVMLGFFVWLVVSYALESEISCDVPLRTYVIGVCTNVVYHTNFCGSGSLHTRIIRHVFRYDPSRDLREGPQPSPWYVKVYSVLVTLGIFVWHCIGLHWVRITKTCESKSPDLYKSAKAFAAFSIVFNVFVYINTVGLYTIMVFMLRNGMIRTDNAAPAGTLDQQKVVQYDSETFKNHQECCICIAEFDDSSEIRRTLCGHVFHGKCLANWLKVSRTCPLCRNDLTVDHKIPVDFVGNAAEC